MRSRPLILDAGAKAKILAVKTFASRRENFYQPDAGTDTKLPVPGANPCHVVHLDTYRCVFTITLHNSRYYRHLSVSVPGDKYPSPYSVGMIASEFGFTGWVESGRWPDDWVPHVHTIDCCIIVVQAVPLAEIEAAS